MATLTSHKEFKFSHPSGRSSCVAWTVKNGEPFWKHTWSDPDIDSGALNIRYHPTQVVADPRDDNGVKAHYDLVTAWIDSGALT